MKRVRRQLKYTGGKRRARLAETRTGPMLLLVFCTALFLMLAFALLRYGVPAIRAGLAPSSGADGAAPAGEDIGADNDDPFMRFGAAGTVALTDVADAAVLADPSVSGDAILFAAGASANALDRLVRYDTVTGEAEGVLVPMQYDTLHSPVEDDARIVYVDAKAGGGGAIRALEKATGETSLVCEIAFDIPQLFYDTPYLVWKERTPAGATKLYACHLPTGDSVTLSVLAPGLPAQSLPSLADGEALYAEAAPGDGARGVIRAVQLADGDRTDYAPGTYVHDPKRCRGALVWATGAHGAGNDLYCRTDDGTQRKIAADIIDFGVAGDVVAYGLDGAVYAYACGSGETRRLSGASEYAQFAAAGGGAVVWRDMANPENPVWKYMRFD